MLTLNFSGLSEKFQRPNLVLLLIFSCKLQEMQKPLNFAIKFFQKNIRKKQVRLINEILEF